MIFTKDQLRKIFAVLEKECGAHPEERESFVYHISRGCQEYRCCFALGFGGKFYPDHGHVSYYEEDRTTKMDIICDRTNKRLEELIETFKKEIDGDN